MSLRIHTTVSSEKTTFSVYFTRHGFVSIGALPKRKRFNSAFFTLTILLSIVGNINVPRPKIQVQGYWLYINNAKLHNAALSLQKNEEARFTRLSQPPYSSDLALCHFFLFGYLKKNEKGGTSDPKTR
jgi:hypothetical protein